MRQPDRPLINSRSVSSYDSAPTLDIDDYIAAATAENTRRSYQSGVRHFELEWNGLLPATADSVARYLAHYAAALSINTLRSRLAAIAQWHLAQGFPDPTKSIIVRKTLKGIQATHGIPARQAKPVQLDQLTYLSGALEAQAVNAQTTSNQGACLTALRNRALLLMGFWGAFRTDELSRLRIEHVNVDRERGMTLRIGITKTERSGASYSVPALSRLCPVTAYLDWIGASGLNGGPLFRRIDRWGRISDTALNPGSMIPMLRRILRQAGVEDIDNYTGHSLRRGFATWASANGWDLRSLMAHVGWKDPKSALRYIELADSNARNRIEAALSLEAIKSLDR